MGKFTLCFILLCFILACGIGGKVVTIRVVSPGKYDDLNEEERAKIAEIKKKAMEEDNHGLKNVILGTRNYTINEYLSAYPETESKKSQEYTIGGTDVLNINIHEEPGLIPGNTVTVNVDGYISLPYIRELYVKGLTTGEVERLIADRLAEKQIIIGSHVTVTIAQYNSKKYKILGMVGSPGNYPLLPKERVLDAISRCGGIDFEQGGKEAMIIRTLDLDTDEEEKIVIRLELSSLLKEGNQVANILLAENDLLYIPKADFYYLIGQVRSPGSYPYLEKEITLVEAISKAGGFTEIAARNRTRIIRIEGDVEKIIEVKVDAITSSGQRAQDVVILPNDVIVVPESYF